MNNRHINQLIHDLAREVIDKEVEIDNEAQGDTFADALWDDITTTIDIFVDGKKERRKREAARREGTGE